MSGILTYPVEELQHLIVEDLSGDGIVRGFPTASEIEITYRGHDKSAQFVPEGSAVRFFGARVERIVVPEAMHISIGSASGDLRVQGLAGEVTLDGVEGDLRLEALSGSVLLRHVAGDIRADDVAELQILGACAGDIRFSGGDIAGETVAGDLRVTRAGALRLRQVHGDLSLERMSGSVDLEHVSGDARLVGIEGKARIGMLMGDLRAVDVLGGLAAPQVNGDAVLEGEFGEGAIYTIASNGDLHVGLPGSADVELSVSAAGRIRSDLPLTPRDDGTPVFTATLGEGTGSVNLTARGNVRITQAGAAGARWQPGGRKGDPFGDLDNLGDRIRQQVYASLAAAGINAETGEVNVGRGGRWRAPRPERPERPAQPAPPAPPAPPVPPRSWDRGKGAVSSPGPSSEERLAILKMVQEGKITAEEADTLLRALGS
jgi:DUF4097 and DUF4098 domain-containing protein YvlB